MHIPRFSPVFGVFLILLTLAAAAYATDTWDATTDFGPQNPNGAWSYGYGTTGTSFTPYSLYSPNCEGGIKCWYAPFYGDVPRVGFNPTGQFIDWGTVVFPPDTLSVHPYAGEDTIVQWTAPATGTYSIAGFFDILDIYPTGIIGLVYENGTQLYSGEILGPPAQFPDKVGGREDFSFSALNLKAGDVISFAVNDDNDFYYDTTGFDATITLVPEPGSLLLVASGLAATGGFVRRKLKK